MRILLTGHGCAPATGSEPGVTWNWAVNLAQLHDVWVITHAYFQTAIDAYLATNPNPRLHFHYIGRVGWWDRLHLPSVRGIEMHYMVWRWHVLALARELDSRHDFDVVHHVSWNTVSAPPLLGRIGKPFVWGPIGGGQTTPLAFLGGYGTGMIVELLRTVRVRTLPFLPGVRKAVRQATAMFAVNRETINVLERAGASKPPLFLDVGIPREILDVPLARRPIEGDFVVLWAAVMEPRKGLDLCLEAARKVTGANVKFLIVGDGECLEPARQHAQRLGLVERVTFLGRLPWADLQALYRSAHVFLFTAVRDSFGTAPLEALAAGAPVICLDHQGAEVHPSDDAVIRIAVSNPDSVATESARAIDALARDRHRLEAMSRAARSYAETEAWDRRALRMQAWYDHALRSSDSPTHQNHARMRVYGELEQQ